MTYCSLTHILLSCTWCAAFLSAAIATTAVWSPAVTGNVYVIGTDPVLHSKPQVTNAAIKFVVDQTGYTRPVTGLYVCLSCYYDSTSINSPAVVAVLSGFGTFQSANPGSCVNDAHKGGWDVIIA